VKKFPLATQDKRLEFARELYNLCSKLASQNGDLSTRDQIKYLDGAVVPYSKDYRLSSFAGGNKRFTTDAGDGDPGPSTRQKGGDGGMVRDLGAHGFEVVPHSSKAEVGTWGLLVEVQRRNPISTYCVRLTAVCQLPPHIFTVCRRTDPRKTELIAKCTRKGSNELEILQYLRVRRAPHIISLIESFHAPSGSWAILPRLNSIHDQLDFDSSRFRGKVAQLCWGLIEGLAYLHEHHIAHMDIKPDNLFYDDAYQLQIADFDVAIQVEDENEEVVGYRGTNGWTAPEVGARDGPALTYSPIKADRWSCGHVLLHILDTVGDGDGNLRVIAEKLKARAPKQRLSLLNWHKWLPVSLPDLTNTSKGGKEDMFQPRQDTPRFDQAMEPPNAKKPRLGPKPQRPTLQPVAPVS
jgi:serine/threonine protein kinase